MDDESTPGQADRGVLHGSPLTVFLSDDTIVCIGEISELDRKKGKDGDFYERRFKDSIGSIS